MTQLCSCLMGGGVKKVEGKDGRAQPTREGGQLIVKSQGGTSCDRTEISVNTCSSSAALIICICIYISICIYLLVPLLLSSKRLSPDPILSKSARAELNLSW